MALVRTNYKNGDELNWDWTVVRSRRLTALSAL